MPALRPAASAKPVDEKITINVGFVDLGQIDLLVQEGFYANRTDLIRTAIRNQLAAHAETLDVRVLGLLSIAPDVTPELALQTLNSLHVLGALHATPQVKTALA